MNQKSESLCRTAASSRLKHFTNKRDGGLIYFLSHFSFPLGGLVQAAALSGAWTADELQT